MISRPREDAMLCSENRHEFNDFASRAIAGFRFFRAMTFVIAAGLLATASPAWAASEGVLYIPLRAAPMEPVRMAG
jgi:hypothetical protein